MIEALYELITVCTYMHKHGVLKAVFTRLLVHIHIALRHFTCVKQQDKKSRVGAHNNTTLPPSTSPLPNQHETEYTPQINDGTKNNSTVGLKQQKLREGELGGEWEGGE